MPDGSVSYVIQFDGLINSDNSINLSDLGESLQGFAKILVCVGNFVSTGQYNRKYSTLGTKVTTNAKLEKCCIELPVSVSPEVANLFSGFAGAVFSPIIAYVISRRKKKEMEYLSAALQQSLAQNKELQDRLMATIDKMSDGLVSATRQALSPIGKSCNTVSVLDEEKRPIVSADRSLKEYFDKPIQKVDEEKTYEGLLTELDKVTGACKLSLNGQDSDTRINGLITDPALQTEQNDYVSSFASGDVVKFKAKAQLSKDNDIVKLFISNTVK